MASSLELQRLSSDRGAIVENVEDLNPCQRASLAKLHELFAFLQFRAFRGEL